MFTPILKSNRLLLGNQQSDLAIISLWTKSTEVAKKIDKEKYAVLGQLFSAERGLDLLVRNLLANPDIRVLVITGIDFSKSGLILKDFFDNGVVRGKTDLTEKPVWRVNSKFPGYIELDIPEEAINALRKTVTCVWVRNLDEFDPTSIPRPHETREKQIFEKVEEEKENIYVGEDESYVIRGKTVVEAWLQILDTIMKFGKRNATHYQDDQKEILNLMSVITDEDPKNLHIPEFLPFDETHVKAYIPRITTDMKIADSSYTYGSRMRSWFGIDQVHEAIKKLVRQPISRAVVINLWDSTKDLTIGGSPCVNHVWLRIRNGKLYMTVTIRSNDMFEAYPDNAFGLRCLQELIREEVVKGLAEKGEPMEISLGSMIINSQSAHIYKDCFDRAQAVVDKYLASYRPAPDQIPDPRGNLHISIEEGQIVVERLSPTNEVIGTLKGKTADELRDKIVRENILGTAAHAIYIGKELQKAEVCMKLGIEFHQDSPLKLPNKSENGQQPYPVKFGINAVQDDEDYKNILRNIKLDSHF